MVLGVAVGWFLFLGVELLLVVHLWCFSGRIWVSVELLLWFIWVASVVHLRLHLGVRCVAAGVLQWLFQWLHLLFVGLLLTCGEPGVP